VKILGCDTHRVRKRKEFGEELDRSWHNFGGTGLAMGDARQRCVVLDDNGDI
jgi:hypothetical protein